MAKLAQADQIGFTISLTVAGQTEITPQVRVTLSPLTTIQQLNQQNSNLATQIDTLTKQRDAAVQAYTGGLPDTPLFVAKRFNGLKVMAQFSTNKPGLLHARLVRASDQMVVSETREKQPDVTHNFTFDNTFPGTSYYIDATVVDPSPNPPADVPGKTITGRSDPQLRVDMPATLSPPPHISNLSVKPTSKSVTVTFQVDTPAALQVTCFRIADPTKPDDRVKVGSAKSFDKDLFGLAYGPAVVGNQSFTCSGLDSQQTYVVEVEAVDDFNQKLGKLTTISTMTPAPLDFDGAVQLTVTAAGLQVAWNATINGASGKMKVQIPSVSAVEVDVTAKDKAFSTTIALDKLAAALNPATSTLSATPVLVAEMSSGSDSVSRSFAISVGIPATKQAAQSLGAAVPNAASSLANVANGVQNPSSKKFTWQDLVQTGLGVLVKLI